jgi:hypothetical protein
MMKVSTRQRWWWVVAAALIVAACTAVLVVYARPTPNPEALVPPTGYSWEQNNHCHVNETQYAGFSGFDPRGHDQIHFAHATLTGVPSSISVRGIYAINIAENHNYPILGGVAGEEVWSTRFKGIRLEPISDVAIDPANPDAQWWLVVAFIQTVHLPHPVRTSGLRIDYSAGSVIGATVFPYEIITDCS